MGVRVSAGTITSAEAAEQALNAVTTLLHHTFPSTGARLAKALDECGLEAPLGLEGWAGMLQLLVEVRDSLTLFGPGIFGDDLPALAAAIEPAGHGGLSRVRATVLSSAYRMAQKRARLLSKDPSAGSVALQRAVASAAGELEMWRQLAIDGGTPRIPVDLTGVVEAYAQLSRELEALGTSLGGTLENLSPAALLARLSALEDDRATLYRLPSVARLTAALRNRGLGPLLDEIAARNLSVRQAVDCLDYVWLSSILETISLSDPRVGTFSAESVNRTVEASARRTRST